MSGAAPSKHGAFSTAHGGRPQKELYGCQLGRSNPIPGTIPGTGTAYPATTLPTVGPYALPVPGIDPEGAAAMYVERAV